MATTPIGGNQDFTSVVNLAAQLPSLSVGGLETSDATIVDATIVDITLEDGQFTTKQGDLPTASATNPEVPVKIYGSSTDVSGRLELDGTAGPGTEIKVVFNRPFPIGADVNVQLTACDEESAAAIATGLWVSPTGTSGFVITFEEWATGVPVPLLNPCFNYFVTAFAPLN